MVDAKDGYHSAKSVRMNTCLVGVSGLGKFFDSTPIWQGAYMSWNHSGGDGYTDFMCKRGFGPGGYQFYLSANNATTFADGKTTLAILDENGITMTQGIYSAPGSIVGSMLATGRAPQLFGVPMWRWAT